MSNTTPDSGNDKLDPNAQNTTPVAFDPESDTAVAPTAPPADADREIVIDYDSAVDPEPENSSSETDAALPVAHEHHVPEVADKAYAEEPDTHVLSATEPTVLTQADLREAEIRDAEAGTGAVGAEQTVAQRAMAERAEADRVEAERIEAERIEAERVEAERAEAERADKEAQRAAEARAAADANRTEAASPAAPVRQPIYVQAPSKPKPKSNRGFGILVSLLATLAFAVLYAGILALILLANNGSVDVVGDVLARAPYWIPVLFFFLAMALLVAIVNRGGWWAYVLGGFAVAAIVYGSYLGGVLIDVATTITPAQVGDTVRRVLLSPAAIIAFLVAREVPIWFGAWIAARGRKVRERNAEAQAEYERVLEQGPVVA
ncbi:hypothetical protein [Mycetocola zhadangensis]|uniref:Uncharacterized protein n=1 Tax=Mycetocola zhadangensis TaxID=1164595 RepID=A0A3L7J447_9MICO|nr:hypothetical protein [Mycetocola zhadangensis]RLQ85363.1 hypothetical protein D9V28_00245 [Mycetocola zhadangensis]GGE81965.1 hypothetical protein GCM10011313_00480 [Mycetocola zhadangensis]